MNELKHTDRANSVTTESKQQNLVTAPTVTPDTRGLELANTVIEPNDAVTLVRSKLRVLLGNQTSHPVIQLSDPLIEEERFKRELVLLQALEHVAAANSLNPSGDVFRDSVIVDLTKPDKSRLSKDGASVHLFLSDGVIFRAIESPEPGLMILVVPQRFHEPIKSAIKSQTLETLVVNIGDLFSLKENSPIRKIHPYERTLELTNEARISRISDLPSILRSSKHKNPADHYLEKRLNNSRYYTPSSFIQLAEIRRFRAVSSEISNREDEIIAFVRDRKPEAFSTFVQICQRSNRHNLLSITQPIINFGNYISKLALRNTYSASIEARAKKILDSSHDQTTKATLLCRLIRLASRTSPTPNDLSPT